MEAIGNIWENDWNTIKQKRLENNWKTIVITLENHWNTLGTLLENDWKTVRTHVETIGTQLENTWGNNEHYWTII